jgi:hypothetical protein
MDFFENVEAIRGWLLAQPWLGFARDWVAEAPAWQIFGALSAPIVIILLAFVLVLLRVGSGARNGSSETVEEVKPSEPTIEEKKDPAGVESSTTGTSPESSTVAAEMLTESRTSTPAPELDATVTSTEQAAVATEATADPSPSTPMSKIE